MKKLLALALVLALALCALPFGAFAAEGTLGDVNGSGSIDITDVQMVLKYINKQRVPVTDETADVNGDGVVDISDVQHLLKYVNGQDVVLGEQPLQPEEPATPGEEEYSPDPAYEAYLTATSYIGRDVNELIAVIGQPSDSAYQTDADGTIMGTLSYQEYGIQVYTLTLADGMEIVTDAGWWVVPL